MDLLCICAENKGYVLVGGKKPDVKTIAKVTGGTDADEIEKLLNELVENEVCSVDRRGVIYCRRIVKAEINRRNGRLAGPSKLRNLKQNQNSLGENSEPPIPESRVHKPESKEERTPALTGGECSMGNDDWPLDYELKFWTAWPAGSRKHSKKQVFAKLNRIRKQREATWEALMDGVSRYLASKPDPQYIPAPLVWLNGARWEADYQKSNGGIHEGHGRGGAQLGFSGISARLRAGAARTV